MIVSFFTVGFLEMKRLNANLKNMRVIKISRGLKQHNQNTCVH